MGKLIGVTFPIIDTRIGEGGTKYGRQVKRINQLLRLAGYLKTLPSDPKSWNKDSEAAMIAFHKRCGVGPVEPFIDPKDPYDRLFTLALTAGVLIPLPAGLRSSSAITVLFEHCRKNSYPYGWVKGDHTYGGGTRMIWGFEGRPSWAIATLLPKDDYGFPDAVPVSMNCTSFANLMLSAWIQGNAHSAPYDCSQMVGGYDPLGSRYGLQPVNDNSLVFDGYCFDVDGVVANAKQDRLYHLGLCPDDSGFITHDVVLLNGVVYECNTGKTPAVYTTPVRERLKKIAWNKGCVRMLGPAPY